MRTIPLITNAKLADLADRIKPLIRKEDGLYDIEPVDLRDVSFLWDPKPTTKASVVRNDTKWITTYHSWGYYGLFKPSVAEVLCQLSEFILAWKPDAFELTHIPEPLLMNPDDDCIDGYHRANVQLFKRF